MHKRGILTVVSGFSGAGKGTVMKRLVSEREYSLSISATTRQPRTGEEHGREYFFLTKSEFESMIEQNELIEWAEYVGNYYGTPKSYVEQQLDQGKNVILEIEIQGALKVKEQFPDTLLLFIAPPSAKELKNRLIGRGTDSMEVIEQRLSRAADEADYMKDYDYIIINDVLDDCVNQIDQIIQDESSKTKYNLELIQNMKTELSAFKKGDC